MPTVSWVSKVKAVSEHCQLSLNVRHRLVAGTASERIYALKKSRIPEGVNIVASSLVMAISGTLDGAEITPEQLNNSEIGCHLVEHLRAVDLSFLSGNLLTAKQNASELGLSTVRNCYISDIDGFLRGNRHLIHIFGSLSQFLKWKYRYRHTRHRPGILCPISLYSCST